MALIDPGSAAALLALAGTIFNSVATMRVANRNANVTNANQAEARRDARIDNLEKQLDGARAALAEARERHMATVERLMDEEEALRDRHAEALAEARARVDELRVQVMALRAELLHRGINPDRLLGEPVAA